jgi:hypothetical protein
VAVRHLVPRVTEISFPSTAEVSRNMKDSLDRRAAGALVVNEPVSLSVEGRARKDGTACRGICYRVVPRCESTRNFEKQRWIVRRG